MRSARSLVCTLLALAVAMLGGCGNGSSTVTGATEGSAKPAVRPDAAARICYWGFRPNDDTDAADKDATIDALPHLFVRADDDPVHLLLERSMARPGSVLAVAVENESDASVDYGTAVHLENQSGDPVHPSTPLAFQDIGLTAPAHGVGPCVIALVPRDAVSGDYELVLEDVGGAPDEADDLRAPLRVAGPPVTQDD